MKSKIKEFLLDFWPAVALLVIALVLFPYGIAVNAAAKAPAGAPVMALVDRFEEGETGELFCVVSIDEPPYTLSFPAENDFEDLKPGDWLILTLDARGRVCDVNSIVGEAGSAL